MEAKDLHSTPAPGKNLLDKIASDPDIINRGAAEPASVVTQAVPAPEVTGVGSDAPMGTGNKAPVFNLLDPQYLPVGDAPAAVPVTSTTATAGAGGAIAAQPAPKKRRGKLPLVIAVLVLLVAGGGAAGYMLLRPQSEDVVVLPPTQTPTATPTATPTPTPTPTAPTPTPVPVNVTAPVIAPTVERPQEVKVTSPSGLWLRSSPDSSNQSNVIGWMSNGSTVSVDATGDFWWHGTYKGEAGYFAVNYTK